MLSRCTPSSPPHRPYAIHVVYILTHKSREGEATTKQHSPLKESLRSPQGQAPPQPPPPPLRRVRSTPPAQQFQRRPPARVGRGRPSRGLAETRETRHVGKMRRAATAAWSAAAGLGSCPPQTRRRRRKSRRVRFLLLLLLLLLAPPLCDCYHHPMPFPVIAARFCHTSA